MTALPPKPSVVPLTVLPEHYRVEEKPSAATQAPNRHEEFYFTDGMSIIQVENRLFRVHGHFLAENSPIFKAMFSLPVKDGRNADGMSDASPIHLSGVTVLEFETLLQFSYRGMHPDFSLPRTSWTALLSIAHRYEITSVCERATREIFKMPSKERKSDPRLVQHLFSVVEKYDVSRARLFPWLVALVKRRKPLKPDEVALFSPLTMSRIARAREDCARRSGSSKADPYDVEDIVRRIWRITENMLDEVETDEDSDEDSDEGSE